MPINWDKVQAKIHQESAFFAVQNDMIESLGGNLRAADHTKLWSSQPCWEPSEYGTQWALQKYWEAQWRKAPAEEEDI